MKEYEFNPNNIEHCLERAEALKAKKEGHTIEYMDWHIGDWNIRNESGPFNPCGRYRRKPTPVARDWDRKSDVPLNCWMTVGGREYFITGVDVGGVKLDEFWLEWAKIKSQGWTHSTDRVNWLPCTTTEP